MNALAILLYSVPALAALIVAIIWHAETALQKIHAESMDELRSHRP